MLSVIVPVFNEEESLNPFFKELTAEFKKLKVDYEVIFVDDGSSDNSLTILKEFHSKEKSVHIFSFRRNRGKAEALTFGFQKARGELIATLDADLQDKPSEISKLIKKQEEGWDAVSGWRKNRKDSIVKVISSKFFNLIASVFWGTKLHDYNCGLKLYTSDAAKSLNLYGGRHRFIPLFLHEDGFRVTEIPVTHEKRKFGKSKYGFSKVFTEIPDMFTMLFLSKYAKRPLHFFAPVGGLLFIAGTIVLLYLTVLRIEGYTIGNRPLLFLGILLVISGIQIFFTGFLADLFLHSSDKVSERKMLKFSSDE
ncbi:MAG: glycosyltransferase family 2 protein [Candidatus Levybacteria bacterium]|nr:glycosyltransferase family 2 protein [Candidatus Levybacteria bacterium]